MIDAQLDFDADHDALNKATPDQALALYRDLGADVELIEMTSTDGLRRLIAAGKEFDLIYIDGLHECLVPASDFGMSLACHAEAVAITWKTAAYRVRG